MDGNQRALVDDHDTAYPSTRTHPSLVGASQGDSMSGPGEGVTSSPEQSQLQSSPAPNQAPATTSVTTEALQWDRVVSHSLAATGDSAELDDLLAL